MHPLAPPPMFAPAAPLARTLETATDFVLGVLDASEQAAHHALTWVDINRLAARWLRPDEAGDTSRLGHAIVLEMAGHGLLDAEMTTAADGALMVARAAIPTYWGTCTGRVLAA